MKNHYIPEDRFPLAINDQVNLLGNYFFNLFLVRGTKKSAIFEVGISAVIDTVIRQIKQLGVTPDFLICSHPHSDHMTGLEGLTAEFPNAQVIVADGAKQFIKHPKAVEMLFAEDVHMSKSLDNLGLKPGREPVARLPELETAFVISTCHTLDLGGISIELEVVEGHSPGNLIAKVPEHRILFCSDSLGFHFPGRRFLPLYFTGARSYLDTLKNIETFAPSVICPAHQGPLTGDRALAAIAESIRTTTDLISGISNSMQDDEQIANQIFESHYKDEFAIYSERNIRNCASLLVKRARQFMDES